MRKGKDVAFDRNDGISLKGIAAFFVIASHLYVYGGFKSIEEGLIAHLIGTMVTQLGGIGVLIFLFVSGYGIQEGYNTKKVGKQYLLNRIRKVWMPYLCIKFLFIVIGKIFNVRNIIKAEDWFIFVITFEYIVYYLVRKVTENKKSIVFGMLVFNAVGSFLCICLCFPAKYFNSMWLFVVGVVFSCYQKKIVFLLKKNILFNSFLALICFLCLGIIFTIFKGQFFCEACKPVSGIALVVFLCCILRNIELKSPVLKWGGKNSLQLYVVHVSLHDFFPHLNGIFMVIYLIITVIIVEGIVRITDKLRLGTRKRLENF
ncbi:acyltransferase family protein [Butyrivibrio sp. YAB3001]|uniref:acyltransferase family protein n=1 Tax=Butyrivibrio sp. YAB3001 TaxID=1520812 RepID=UPI0015881759|nr:acyltransferase [Butyrivibrio sp. YAB3001]